MKLKEQLERLSNAVEEKYFQQFGFRIKETTFSRIVEYLHVPKDSSSLAVTRILFGLAMLFDIPDERGGATMAEHWGHTCHFPLLPFITPLPMPYMAAVYAALWLGALGIMVGYKYRISSLMFTICYWYLFLIEKSYWNNHSYLFGLVALLLSCTQANCFWSIDTYLDPSKEKQTVPYWNYFILKYQFFILYFMAGMKKGTAEWLSGYSMQTLSEHWVFDPFKLFLTVPQIDFLIVHCFIFMFDLTVAFWMMWERTRYIAMVFCAMFHLMNSRLFSIGMFPWVCLVTMPLYCPFDWPKALGHCLKNQHLKIKALVYCYVKNYNSYLKRNYVTEKDKILEVRSGELLDISGFDKPDGMEEVYEYLNIERKIVDGNCDEKENINFTEDPHKEMVEGTKESGAMDDDLPNESTLVNEQLDYNESNAMDQISGTASNVSRRQKLTTCMIIFYVFIQAFLPYSHFITKGYNNWANGLYGYSWDMMVHTWDTESVIIKIVDKENQQVFYMDPSVYAPNDRWVRHGDMVHQYAKCLNEKVLKERAKLKEPTISDNLAVHFDIWCSLNNRFTQRVFDSKVDILQAPWSPFKDVSYLMPLLDEAIHWRSTLKEISEEVHSWDNRSDVLFFADFPNYEQEKYIPPELSNVSLTILEGDLAFEHESTSTTPGHSFKLSTGNKMAIEPGIFHKILNIGDAPAYYMYTFMNNTENINGFKRYRNAKEISKLPILKELFSRFKAMIRFAVLVSKSFMQMLFGCNCLCKFFTV